MNATSPVRHSPVHQLSSRGEPLTEALQLVRNGRASAGLRVLTDNSGSTLGMGDKAAAMMLAQLSSTSPNRIAAAEATKGRMPSEPTSHLQRLARAHLAMVQGDLTLASRSLRGFAYSCGANDAGVLVDGSLLGARIALLRDDVDEAAETLSAANALLADGPPHERARLEAYSLILGVTLAQQLGQADKLIGLGERLGPATAQLLGGHNLLPAPQAHDERTSPPITNGSAHSPSSWHSQLLGCAQPPEAALLLWGAAQGLTSDTTALGKLGDLEPLLRRRLARERLAKERFEMGFAGELLHVLLANRSEQSYQRALMLVDEYPDDQSLEQLRMRLAAHVGQLPLATLARKIEQAPNDLCWLELGIEVALEVGDAAHAQKWAETAYQIWPGGRTAGWRVRAAQVAQLDWPMMRTHCELALGFLGSSVTSPFTQAHAMKVPVQMIYAEALVGCSEPARAKGLVLQVMRDNPDAFEAYLRLGEAEISLGDYAAADRYLTHFLEDGRALNHPLGSQARLSRAFARVRLDKPGAARDDLRAVSPGQSTMYKEALERVHEVDALRNLVDMGVHAHILLADLRQLVNTGDPREVDLTLREHLKRPENSENVEFLTLLAKNNYRMGKSHDGMTRERASQAIVIALAEGREAVEAAQILLDVNRRNPSLFRTLRAAGSSVMSWLTSTVFTTGTP